MLLLIWMLCGSPFFAPQAQLEESANDRTSRRCSLVDFLREIGCSFWEPLLRGFATGIWHLAVQNAVPAEPEISQIFSVSVFFFFVRPLFEQVDGRTTDFSEK